MAGSGSEKRQRQITLKARFTDKEAALIAEQANRAGVSVASLIRYAVLGLPPLRASPQPSVDSQEISRLIAELAALKIALREAAIRGTPGACERTHDAACRDLADMRGAVFMALGRKP